MPTEKQYTAMLHGSGFRLAPEPGFVAYQRTHPDGRTQSLRLFWWSNKKVAAQHGIPNAYLVVLPNLEGLSQGKRYRLPLVDWPSNEQPRRPWKDVAEEFTTVFLAALDAPLQEGREALDALGQRYVLS